jgi:hypothetical protein
MDKILGKNIIGAMLILLLACTFSKKQMPKDADPFPVSVVNIPEMKKL